MAEMQKPHTRDRDSPFSTYMDALTAWKITYVFEITHNSFETENFAKGRGF